jgi:hypothetical protein
LLWVILWVPFLYILILIPFLVYLFYPFLVHGQINATISLFLIQFLLTFPEINLKKFMSNALYLLLSLFIRFMFYHYLLLLV